MANKSMELSEWSRRTIKSTAISILALLYFFIFTVNDYARNIAGPMLGGFYDIMIYGAGLILFVAVLSVFLCCDRAYAIADERFYVCMVIALGLLLFNDLFESAKELPGQAQDTAYYTINKYLLVLIVGVFASIIYVANRKQKTVEETSNTSNTGLLVSLMFAILTVGLSAFRMYSPSIIQNKSQLVHNSAVFGQIYNLIYDEPYSATQFGIYGHYGIFYKVLFDVLGLSSISMRQFVLVQMGVTAICMALFCYVAISLIKNVTVRCMTIFAMALLWGGKTQYDTVTYQALVRLVPLSVLSAFVIVLFNRSYEGRSIKLQTIAAILLCSLCILWNTEFGLIGTAGVAYYFGYRETLRTKKIWLSVAKGTILIIISFCLSYILFNFFNIVCMGGEWQSPDIYLIPYFSDVPFISESLPEPLLMGNYPWVWILIACLILIVPSFAEVLNKRHLFKAEQWSAAPLAIMTVGGLVYYINRSMAGCLWILYPMGVLMVCLIVDLIFQTDCGRFHSEKDKQNRPFMGQVLNGIKLLACVFIAGFITCASIEMYGCLHNETSFVYDRKNEGMILIDNIQNVSEEVPVLGLGSELICSYRGWKNEYLLTDAPYCRKEAIEKYRSSLLDGKRKVYDTTQLYAYIKAGVIDKQTLNDIDEMYPYQADVGSIGKHRFTYIDPDID